jgi:ERCC4-type nuclease
MKVQIDNREPIEVVRAFERLKSELKIKKNIDVELEVLQLFSGDVVIDKVVFERKNALDFIGSITDKRLKNQAAKMSLNFNHIYYVIVGNIFGIDSGVGTRARIGAQCSLAVRHNAKFIHVSDIEGFAWACYTTAAKISDGETFDPYSYEQIKYEITPTDRFVSMVAQTGIGKEKARIVALACKYQMSTLLLWSENELSDIKGIGKASARKVYRILHTEDAE